MCKVSEKVSCTLWYSGSIEVEVFTMYFWYLHFFFGGGCRMGLHYTLKIDYFKGEVFLHLKSWSLDPIWSKFVFSQKKCLSSQIIITMKIIYHMFNLSPKRSLWSGGYKRAPLGLESVRIMHMMIGVFFCLHILLSLACFFLIYISLYMRRLF